MTAKIITNPLLHTQCKIKYAHTLYLSNQNIGKMLIDTIYPKLWFLFSFSVIMLKNRKIGIPSSNSMIIYVYPKNRKSYREIKQKSFRSSYTHRNVFPRFVA